MGVNAALELRAVSSAVTGNLQPLDRAYANIARRAARSIR